MLNLNRRYLIHWKQVLVVQEKYCSPAFANFWKIPTGFIVQVLGLNPDSSSCFYILDLEILFQFTLLFWYIFFLMLIRRKRSIRVLLEKLRRKLVYVFSIMPFYYSKLSLTTCFSSFREKKRWFQSINEIKRRENLLISRRCYKRSLIDLDIKWIITKILEKAVNQKRHNFTYIFFVQCKSLVVSF